MKNVILCIKVTAGFFIGSILPIATKAYDAPVKGAVVGNSDKFFSYSIADSVTGQVVSGQSQTLTGSPGSYSVQAVDDGIVYWGKVFDSPFGGEHNYVGFITYDPTIGQWKQTNDNYASATGVSTYVDGVGAYWVSEVNFSRVRVAIYEPDSRAWITDSYASGSSGGSQFWGGIAFANKNGVVAWSYALESNLNRGIVEYTIYDPTRKRWVWGANFTNRRGVVEIINGTVFFYDSSDRYVGIGYSVSQGRWVLDQRTSAISSFRVGGSYSNSAPTARWSTDMSVGANNTLSWGDGAVSAGASGFHIYPSNQQWTLTQNVSGWIGDSASSSITINQNFNRPPTASISVDGQGHGAVVTRPYGGSATAVVRFSATDPDGNLAGIRYNIWNASTGYFDNGGGFVSQSGSSGEVTQTVSLPTSGDWYFWTDAEDSSGEYHSTGSWGNGFKLTVVEAAVPARPPTASISVDGYNYGSVLTRPSGGSVAVTVHYSATDPDGDLAGIRYNVWNSSTGYFDNGGAFAPQSGSSGDVAKTFTLDSSGDWYFWTDAVDSQGGYHSTGDWGSGFKITVVEGTPAANRPPAATISVDGYAYGSVVTRPAGGSIQVTVRYAATDPDGNLSGIRYNIWNASTGYFDNGGNFAAQSGSSGEVVLTFTLDSDGEWYFWTDAQDSEGAYHSSGDWGGGFKLIVTQ